MNLFLGLESRVSFFPFAQGPSRAAKIFTYCVLSEMAIFFSQDDLRAEALVFLCSLVHNISNYKPLDLYSNLMSDTRVPLGSVFVRGRTVKPTLKTCAFESEGIICHIWHIRYGPFISSFPGDGWGELVQ